MAGLKTTCMNNITESFNSFRKHWFETTIKALFASFFIILIGIPAHMEYDQYKWIVFGLFIMISFGQNVTIIRLEKYEEVISELNTEVEELKKKCKNYDDELRNVL